MAGQLRKLVLRRCEIHTAQKQIYACMGRVSAQGISADRLLDPLRAVVTLLSPDFNLGDE
jgi:hypothetical protein